MTPFTRNIHFIIEIGLENKRRNLFNRQTCFDDYVARFFHKNQRKQKLNFSVSPFEEEHLFVALENLPHSTLWAFWDCDMNQLSCGFYVSANPSKNKLLYLGKDGILLLSTKHKDECNSPESFFKKEFLLIFLGEIQGFVDSPTM